MLVEADLKAWLGDRAAQRRVAAAAGNFTRNWMSGPVHHGFDRAFAALGDCTTEQVAAAACTLFADEAWLDALVADLAEAMRQDRYFDPPFRAVNSDIHTGLLVYEDTHVTIAAGVSRLAALARRKQTGQGKGSVNFTGQLSVLRFLKSDGLTLGFWECDPIGADFSATAAGECRYVGARQIADGETIVVDGRRQSFIIERAAANFVVIQAHVKTGQAPVSVEYDAETRRFLGCSAVDEGDCRIQMMTSLVRTLDHEEAFLTIAAFLDHPSFFVRWHAMKELLGMDVRAALPSLKRMAARDPHPDARAAARQVLDRIEQPAKPRKAA